MSKGPGLFSGIGQKARDLLNNGYSTDQKFVVTTYSDSGVALVSNVVKKGGLGSGDVLAQFQFKHTNAFVDFKFDTESNILTTLTVINPSSGKGMVSIKLPDYNSLKLEGQYFHEHAAFTAAVGLGPALDYSATIGTPSIAFGAEASFNTDSCQFSKHNYGVSFTKPDCNASLILADKGDSLRVSYLHYLNELKRGAVGGEIARKFSTNENTLTVGCAYVVDDQTLLKAKLNNHGNLCALIHHELKPKSFLTISGAFDTMALEKTPKFGLALSLKP